MAWGWGRSDNYNNSNQRKEYWLDSIIPPVWACLILTVLAVIAVLLGLVFKSALLICILILPLVIYEIYRTSGWYTTASSWILLIALVAEIIFIIFGINYDVGQYLNMENAYVAGQYIPLGDIKVLCPVLLAVFSIILLIRTYGPYTKWLSVVIFISAFCIIYILNPHFFSDFLRNSVQRIFWYF